MQLRKDWACAIRLVVLLVPYSLNRDQVGIGETGEQSMHSPGAGSGEADQLIALEASVRLSEQEPEDTLLDGGE